jgi:hypothetical protein
MGAIKAAKAPSPAVVELKRALSAAARKAMVLAAKRRWAAIKAGKATNPFAKAKERPQTRANVPSGVIFTFAGGRSSGVWSQPIECTGVSFGRKSA